MTTATRLAGMADVPNPNADVESQTAHSITSRPSRASLPPSRRPSHRALHSSKSRSSLGPGPTASLPPLPTQSQTQPHSHRFSQRYADTPATTTTGTSAAWTTQPPSAFLSPGTTTRGTATGTSTGLSRGTDTASLTSHRSGSAAGAADDDDNVVEWGPAHPCLPHPNPHVAAGSPAALATRIVRIQRDWLVAGDAYPAVANLYPEILAEWVDEPEFRALVTELNTRLKEAFAPDAPRAVLDAVLGVATGFLWDDLGAARVKGRVKELEGYMEAWNEERRKQGNPVRLIPLRRTGYMNLDIQIPDPGIDFVEDED